MENIAPNIVRQRLLIEGYYTNEVDDAVVKAYLTGLADHLNLRHYGEPIVHAPSGAGKEDNEGYDAFLPLIDSGISLYVWTKAKFFAAVVFTCKAFDNDEAVAFSQRFFTSNKLVHSTF